MGSPERRPGRGLAALSAGRVQGRGAPERKGCNLVQSAHDIDAYVGRRLRERREALGISQGRLGRHLGLTFSQVQKYEKGSNRIGAGRLFQIAAFLGVPTSHFFEGLGPDGEAGAAGRGAERQGSASPDEIRTLTAAFDGIVDHGTRASVLALVKSLAEEDRGRRHREN